MFIKVRKKWFGWLAMLALCPALGWGQEFSVHPQNMSVCAGKEAVFTAQILKRSLVDSVFWVFDGVIHGSLPSNMRILIEVIISGQGLQKQMEAKISYSELFNGISVEALLLDGSGEDDIYSHAAYLSYETNQQFSVTNLTPTISGTTVRFGWDAHNSSLTTQYLFGVYDNNNNLIANQTTNTTKISYDLPCQNLELRVTADQCPNPDSTGFVQNEAATFVYRKPDIDISPITAKFDNNQTVLVSWTLDGGNAFRITITDLDSGHDIEVTTENDSPFNYTLKTCGQHNLNVSVSPEQCAEEPGFTHSDTISFTIPCPTTETETADQTSGALTNYPSLLLTVAAVIPLLKYFPKPN